MRINDSVEGRARATQADVARRAGVSQATVSLVLNGAPGGVRISEETRARVMAAVRDEHYVANAAARSLAGGRNDILGIYTFESVFPTDSHDFYFPFLVGIEQQAEELGLDLLLFTSAGGQRQMYRGGQTRLALADGALLLGRWPNLGEIERLRDENFPFVYIGHREVKGTPISYVAADYPSATAELTARALGLGHRRFAYLREGDGRSYPSQDRESGYREALRAAGVPASSAPVWNVADAGELPAVVAETQRARITAVLVEQTELAAELTDAAGAVGLSAPADLSVIVLGDDIGARDPSRDWTRLWVPGHEMGAAATRLLTGLIEGTATGPVHQLVPCELQDGQTLVAPSAGSR
jgi:DNA-binding LacI/PurR family transcriptional regulator